METDFESLTLEKARALMDIRRFDEAAKEAAIGLASNPDSVALHCTMSRAMMGLDKLIEADQSVVAAIRLAPDNPYPYFLRTYILARHKSFDQQLEMAQTAARLDPEEPVYLRRLAESQLQSGMLREAQATCQQVAKLLPDSPELFELMADIHMELEEYEDAEQHYRRALAYDPNDVGLLNDVARCLVIRKRSPEAIDLLFQAMRLNPTHQTLRDNLYLFVNEYLAREGLKGRRKAALQELPEPVQVFYQDQRQRSPFFQKYSSYGMYAFWSIGLILLALILDFVQFS